MTVTTFSHEQDDLLQRKVLLQRRKHRNVIPCHCHGLINVDSTMVLTSRRMGEILSKSKRNGVKECIAIYQAIIILN